MDVDNRKVYGDTSIFDGLVSIIYPTVINRQSQEVHGEKQTATFSWPFASQARQCWTPAGFPAWARDRLETKKAVLVDR